MKALIIVLACFLAVAYSKAINAKCDPQRFNSCTDAFAKALGLPYMPTDASVLDKQIKDIIAKEGAAGQKRICDYDRSLQSCFGDEYSSCVSVDFLKSIGESEADAKQFVALAQQLVNTCKSSTSFAVNAKCEPQRFDKCTDTFAKALGLPQMPTDASVLDKQIKDIVAKEGAAGQKRVCEAAGKLQQCLGDEYDSCISVDFLKSIGESEADAKKFVALAQQLLATCKTTASLLLSQVHLFNPNVLLGCNNIACNSCMVTCQLTGGTAEKCQPGCDGMFGCSKCN